MGFFPILVIGLRDETWISQNTWITCNVKPPNFHMCLFLLWNHRSMITIILALILTLLWRDAKRNSWMHKPPKKTFYCLIIKSLQLQIFSAGCRDRFPGITGGWWRWGGGYTHNPCVIYLPVCMLAKWELRILEYWQSGNKLRR